MRASWRYRPDSPPMAWLLTIARNAVTDYYRRSEWRQRSRAVSAGTLLDEHHPRRRDRYPSDYAHLYAALDDLTPSSGRWSSCSTGTNCRSRPLRSGSARPRTASRNWRSGRGRACGATWSGRHEHRRARGITLQSEVERLRARTHELQERHDKEMATLRKQLKQEVRRTEAYRASWWHESPYQHLTVTMLRGA